MSKLSTPKTIIFDWDNTLVDTWPIIHRALHDTFVEFGMEPWPMEKVISGVAKSMRDSFPDLFGEKWREAGERYQAHYRAHHIENLVPMPGALPVLEAVAARSLPMLVVSNKRGLSLREEVAHLGWKDFFSGVIGSDDAARDKPHPDPVHLALSHLEAKAGPEVWFVGDSEVDLETAAAAGCSPVLYGVHATKHSSFTPTHYRGHAYLAYVADHATLLKLLSHCHPRP